MQEESKEKSKDVSFESLRILSERWKNGTFSEIIDDWKWIFGYSARYKGAIVFYTILGILSTSLGLVGSDYDSTGTGNLCGGKLVFDSNLAVGLNLDGEPALSRSLLQRFLCHKGMRDAGRTSGCRDNVILLSHTSLLLSSGERPPLLGAAFSIIRKVCNARTPPGFSTKIIARAYTASSQWDTAQDERFFHAGERYMKCFRQNPAQSQ